MLRSRRTDLRRGAVLVVTILCFRVTPIEAGSTNQASSFGLQKGDTIRVSVSSDGVDGNRTSGSPSISRSGRFVAFTTGATNLAEGNSTHRYVIVVKDLETNRFQLISRGLDGTGPNGHSSRPSISASGRYIAFESSASNLTTGDRNQSVDIFVYDRRTGLTERVSVHTDGAEGDGNSEWPQISPNGRFVAFVSEADNLTDDDQNAHSDAFVHDRFSGITERVSQALASRPRMSRSGRFVVFGEGANIRIHDRAANETATFLRPETVEPTNSCFDPWISGTGDWIAFGCHTTSLAPGHILHEVFLQNRISGSTHQITRGLDGTVPDHDSVYPVVSHNGRLLAFESKASNLIEGDTNGVTDVYIYHRTKRSLRRVSVSSTGKEANRHSFYPEFNRNGRFVVFMSRASNLVEGDTNGVEDVFLHRLR